MCKGGFNLTKFTSNDREVLSSLSAEKRANPNLDLSLDKLPNERTLGISWNLESDELGFKVVEMKKPDTMRGVLLKERKERETSDIKSRKGNRARRSRKGTT